MPPLFEDYEPEPLCLSCTEGHGLQDWSHQGQAALVEVERNHGFRKIDPPEESPDAEPSSALTAASPRQAG